MTRRAWLIGGVAAAAGAAGIGSAWWRGLANSGTAAAAEALPADLWSMRFERPGGGELAFAALRGKPVLLNFWATWCPPCVTEMPLLDAYHREHPGWHVVGLAVDKREPVNEFLQKRGVGFQIGLAGLEGVDLSRKLGNASGALPFTVVFDKTGAALHRKLGAISAADLQDWART